MIRPRLEPLEARLVMALSPLDPTFGTAGVVFGPIQDRNAVNRTVSSPSAVAVQPDGKILTVELLFSSGMNIRPFVHRYNPDGSIDGQFGVDGQVELPSQGPLDPNVFRLIEQVPDLAIAPDGKIVLVTSFERLFRDGSNQSESIIVRLTTTGQLDASFAQDGIYPVDLANSIVATVAVQADGKVVAGGTTRSGAAGDPATQLALLRLTSVGKLDPTFNGTGILPLPLPAAYVSTGVSEVALDPSGRLIVAGYLVVAGTNGFDADPYVFRADATGGADPRFGIGGFALVPESQITFISDFAVQADGRIVLAGSLSRSDTSTAPRVVRLEADGTIDPSFRQAPVLPSALIQRDQYVAVALGPDGTITVGGSSLPGLRGTLLVARYLVSGAVDPNFGTDGRSSFVVPPIPASPDVPVRSFEGITSLALTPSGQVIIFGSTQTLGQRSTSNFTNPDLSRLVLARVLPIATTRRTLGDYDADGKTDIAAQLAPFGAFAYNRSGGGADVITAFGAVGVGATIPAPGDYDGDGITDIAAYLPGFTILAYRPSGGGPDVLVPFGAAGVGNSIPAPGDYDGDGKTDVAVYLPAHGVMAHRPSSGGADVLTSFGAVGPNGSIPTPGDYDGDGITDIAAYLPAFAILAYRPSSNPIDILMPFGAAGVGGSIPTPGDYDGDGKTDPAVYLPTFGIWAYRPSSGGADVLEAFGSAGAGLSIPAPGDYDGDGKTDIAVYLPNFGLFAARPTGSGIGIIGSFGIPGAGQTVPATALATAQPIQATVRSQGLAAAVGVFVPLVDDLMSPESLSLARRKSVVTIGQP